MYYVLFLVADTLPEWYESRYETRVIQHNTKLGPYADSGFDLLCPSNVSVDGLYFMDFQVKAAMYKSETPIDLNNLEMDKYTPSAYYLYPRSSISKTPFRLANSVGIIDRGYRGNVGAYFDCKEGEIEEGQRLVQICSPTLDPFHVVLTDTLTMTDRGEKGFGSTGKI
jgi:dUTP pyrophosphatase